MTLESDDGSDSASDEVGTVKSFGRQCLGVSSSVEPDATDKESDEDKLVDVALLLRFIFSFA